MSAPPSVSWPFVKLGDLARVYSGGTPSRTVPAYWDGEIPWVTTTELERGYVSAARQTITEAGLNASAARMAQPGTLLLAMYGQGKTRGKAAMLQIGAAMNQACAAIEVGKRIDAQFLLYFLISRYDEIRSMSNAGSQENLSGELVRRIPIAVPPIKVQRAIAGVLSDADESIDTLERMIAKKKAIKQGMMQQLLTGKTRLPGFTEPWAEGSFEHLASPSRERAMPQSVAAMTPLVDLDQIEGGSGRLLGTSRTSEAVSLKAVFKPGDVLFGKLRAYLRKFWYADVDGLCTTEIWVLRARAGVHGRFVRYIVETDQFIDAASGAYGTHMPRSDWGTVRALPVAIPPHDEQVAIAAALGDVDTEIELLHQRLAKTRDVKRGTMQELLTGRTRLAVEEVAA